MIFFINSKITDSRLFKWQRYNLKNDDRLNIAKYCFASFAPLEPLISVFIFNLDLAEFGDRKQELEDWILKVLPKEKVVFKWSRCNNIQDWRDAVELMSPLEDPVIFPITWEDHIFWDSNTDIITEGLSLIENDSSVNASILASHYPECMKYAIARGGQLTPSGNFVVYSGPDDSGQRIMKREFFNQHVANPQDPNKVIFRVEELSTPPGPITKIHQPTKEQFRHFDGYSHVGIEGDVVPPIDIPPGFFEGNMIIRYGFDDYDANAVNINPLRNLRTMDPNGVDYNFAIEDIPAFWKPFIKEIQVADNIDTHVMQVARDKHYADMTNISFSSCYGIFNEKSAVPADWIGNHMLIK